MHHYAGIYANHVITLSNHCPPPGVFDILLQLHPQRPVVPAAPQTAIDFAAGEYKASPLAQRDNFIHIYLACFIRHFYLLRASQSLPTLFGSVKSPPI
jgi:hypothetical protein